MEGWVEPLMLLSNWLVLKDEISSAVFCDAIGRADRAAKIKLGKSVVFKFHLQAWPSPRKSYDI